MLHMRYSAGGRVQRVGAPPDPGPERARRHQEEHLHRDGLGDRGRIPGLNESVM